MYEDLIQRLRTARATTPWETLLLCKSNMHEAADAIEELQKDLERSKDFEAFWQQEAEEALRKYQVAISRKPQWIPVTERLPDLIHEYVLCCGLKGGQFVGWVGTGKIVNGRAMAFSPDGKGRYATHWMPLPEPPTQREET